MIYKDLSYFLVGLLFSIHNDLGQFRNEKQYADSFEFKLKKEGLIYEREKVLEISFEGERKGRNRLDFLVENKLIVELKNVRCLSKDHYFQCQRYLASADLWLCLLVNFRPKYLNVQRILNHKKYKK